VRFIFIFVFIFFVILKILKLFEIEIFFLLFDIYVSKKY